MPAPWLPPVVVVLLLAAPQEPRLGVAEAILEAIKVAAEMSPVQKDRGNTPTIAGATLEVKGEEERHEDG